MPIDKKQEKQLRLYIDVALGCCENRNKFYIFWRRGNFEYALNMLLTHPTYFKYPSLLQPNILVEKLKETS